MSFSDLFYPDNPKRREELIRTHQDILNCVKRNFKYANILSDLVNKHYGKNLQHIEMGKDRTFKDISELFMSRLREIQTILQSFDQDLKEKLRPEDYKRLRDANDYSSGEIYAIVKNVAKVVDGVLVGADAIVLAFRFIPKLAKLLPRFAAITSRLSCSTLALLGFGVLFLGVDAILSAIMGAVEREKLNKALHEHKELLEHIEPASEQFVRAVSQIEAILDNRKK